jgi:hypothetical protein
MVTSKYFLETIAMGLAEMSSEAKNQAELTRELASEGKDGFRPALLERFASGGIDTPMHDRRLIDDEVVVLRT